MNLFDVDLNDVRSAFSVIMFFLLAGVYVWAWSKKRKKDFNEAANLPFDEPEYPASTDSTKIKAEKKL